MPKEPRKQAKPKTSYNATMAHKVEGKQYTLLNIYFCTIGIFFLAVKMEVVLNTQPPDIMNTAQDMVMNNIKHSQEVLMARLKSSEGHQYDIVEPSKLDTHLPQDYTQGLYTTMDRQSAIIR